MVWVYNIGIRIYYWGIYLAAFFLPKAKLWLSGRRQLWSSLTSNWNAGNEEVFRIWVHCASLGEFEQGRPLMEGIKRAYPNAKICLTFFSPSGFEIRKNYTLADFVGYIPLDTAYNAEKFIELVQPDLVLFVKYEFWYHHLKTLSAKGIPTFLVAAIFRPEQIFFRGYGGFFRKILLGFERIFVQDQASAELLESIGMKEVAVAGDTRIDRVLALAKESVDLPTIEAFTSQHPTLIAGSTWPPDEKLLAEFTQVESFNNWSMIIAPHEIGEAHLQQIEKQFPLTSIRYSQYHTTEQSEARLLIIDNIGMLSRIYRYGQLAYIGGGFGAGIHNTLEPMASGLPVIFGPKYQKFEEARTMVAQGGASSVKNAAELREAFLRFNEDNQFQKSKALILQYLNHHQGASEQILQAIQPYIFSKRKA